VYDKLISLKERGRIRN